MLTLPSKKWGGVQKRYIMKTQVTQSNKLEWSRKDTILTNNKGLIVVTDGTTGLNSFGGYVLSDTEMDRPFLSYQDNWARSCFTLFEGAVELSND